jgi:hypothetical protein
MRKIVLIAVLAVAGVPAGALAAKPSHPATPASTNANSHANNTSTTGTSSRANAKGQSAKVLFVIHGTLGTYIPANGATNGSIQITVKSSNHESALLKAATPQPLTIPVSSKTKIEGTVTSGHNGIVKIRAAKNASVATLLGLTAFQVIDQGASA